MVPVGWTEKSARNYHSTPCNTLEEERYLQRGEVRNHASLFFFNAFALFDLFYVFARVGNKRDVRMNSKLTT